MNRVISELVGLVVLILALPILAREAHKLLPLLSALLVSLLIVRLAWPTGRR